MLEILKNTTSTDILYDSWVNESKKIFSKFSNDDFFSDKAQHIYFYTGIDDDSVNTLQKMLMDISKTKIDDSGVQISPKPIIIHLNSPGGSLASTDVFYTLIQSQRVPLCVLIEKLCASAATILALLAPYRVMMDYSMYMIHDAFGRNVSKLSDMIQSQYSAYYSKIYYIELLKKKTKLTDNEIKNFIERDILIDAKYCLSKNIIDRILKLPKINKPEYYDNFSNLQLNLSTFLKKTNLNHIYIDENIYSNYDFVMNGNNSGGNISEITNLNNLCVLLDNNFLIKKDNVKPIIIHFKPTMTTALIADSNPLELIQLNYRLAMIQKRVPIIAFIEGSQYFDILSSIIMCPIRIMMKPTIISSTFAFGYGSLYWAHKTIDVIDNSLFIFNNVLKFYKETTNLPNNYYKEMRNSIINFTPKELLKYGIIHLCLSINKKNISNSDIIKYLKLNKKNNKSSKI